MIQKKIILINPRSDKNRWETGLRNRRIENRIREDEKIIMKR